MKVEIVGGPKDGEIYEVPDNFKVPEPTEDLTKNTINAAYTAVELNKLEVVWDILKDSPGVTVREVKPKPPWKA
jgi:hypothetical protein